MHSRHVVALRCGLLHIFVAAPLLLKSDECTAELAIGVERKGAAVRTSLNTWRAAMLPARAAPVPHPLIVPCALA